MSKKIFHLIEGQVAERRYHHILARNAERGKHDGFQEEQGFHVVEDIVPTSFTVEQDNPVEC